VRGLELDGRNPTDLPSPTVNAPGVRFLDNDVTNRHTAICFDLGSAGYGRADRALIARNRIHDCGVLPAKGHDHGIYVEAATGVVIEDNRIHDNADYGVHLFPDAQSTTVRRNLIVHNGMGVTFSGAGGTASSDNLVEDNVIGGSRRGYNAESYWPPGGPIGKGNVLRRNCLFGGTRPASGGIRFPTEGFTAIDNSVAAPSPGSPCVDVVP
jgi:parallel beta-helix repeat protein